MITRLLMCAVVAIALSGCAGLDARKEASERHDRVIGSVVGGSVQVLLSAWGAPDSSYESDGVTYLRYTHSRIVPVPAPLQMGGHNRFVMFGGGAASMACNYIFEVKNGVIISANFHGNDCR